MSAKAIHQARSKPNDRIYTPLPLAQYIIGMANIQPDEWVLDPCRGGGAFYNNLPSCHRAYCELEEGKDFYDWKTPVDVVIGNPPYSQWNRWLEHTLSICKDRFIYVFGVQSLTPRRLKMIEGAGFGITAIHLTKVAWWMSQSLIIVAKKGASSILSYSPIHTCPECGIMCGRGVNGRDANQCAKETREKEKLMLKKA